MTVVAAPDAWTIAVEAGQRHASQRVDELAEAIRVAVAVHPAVIVEIGCDAGGALYAWTRLCADVYGITLADNSPATGGQGYPLDRHGARVMLGDSHDPESLRWLLGQLEGRPIDVLHIDGDHSYAGVDADLRMYGPLVRDGGVILVHDVLNRWDPRVQVHRWWADRYRDRPVIASRRSRPVGFGIIRIDGKDGL